jgi:putative ABC transport system substrate-binding protein
MRRREFFTFLGGATAFLSPLVAWAQQPAPGKWRIAMLAPEIRQAPIREGLRDLGYIEGQNLLIEWRYDNRVDRLAAFATELVGLKPDVIVAAGTQAARAAPAGDLSRSRFSIILTILRQWTRLKRHRTPRAKWVCR